MNGTAAAGWRGRTRAVVAAAMCVALAAALALLEAPAAEASSHASAGPVVVRDGEWHLRSSLTGGRANSTFSYGRANDVPLMGDWNGDGNVTPGVRRGSTFYLRNTRGAGKANIVFSYGRAGDTPIVGDWNGDGRMTVGVVRGSTFHLRNRNSAGRADITFSYGRASDTPIAGDWNDNGTMTIGVVRGSTFHLRNRNSAGRADITFSYGRASDTPIAGDWNGDGTTTIGVIRGNTWLLRNRNSAGRANRSFSYGNVRAGDIPLVWQRTRFGGVPNPTLRPGDRGGQVRELQRRLTDLGYWTGPADGVYDARTRDAVIAFQKVQGLSPDGVYGRNTARALRSPRHLSPRSSSGRWLEIDLRRRVAFTVVNGRVEWIFHASAGHGRVYTFQGSTYRANTTTGRQRITRQIDGVRVAARGRLYRPKYFDSSRGIAIHGYSDVPTFNASSGCVRVSNPAMDFIWSRNLAPIGTNVWVYPENFYN